MTKKDWNACLKEFRKDRNEQPIEMFLLCILLLFMVALVITLIGMLLYHLPGFTIATAIGITLLWKFYRRL